MKTLLVLLLGVAASGCGSDEAPVPPEPAPPRVVEMAPPGAELVHVAPGVWRAGTVLYGACEATDAYMETGKAKGLTGLCY